MDWYFGRRAAGREKRHLETGRKDYHEESKTSHKHSYNAKSGVAVIIGEATRRLLLSWEREIAFALSVTDENLSV